MRSLLSAAVPAALLSALAFVACSDDSSDSEGMNGGSGGTSTAGSAGSSNAAGSGGSGMAGADMGAGGTMMANAGNGGTAGSGMAGSGSLAGSPADDFSFFVTSVGLGDGGNLGGLSGADAHCQTLAEAAGSDRTWAAYLSDDDNDARDRIGTGPWVNFDGDTIAADLDELHDENTVFNDTPNMILDETGAEVPQMEHDILTGTLQDGTAAEGLNCDNWTSNSTDLTENPQVGHSDIPDNPMFSPSWNGAHTSQDCSAAGVAARLGAGRFYCFATD